MVKLLDKRIDEGFLQWFCYVKEVENDKIAKGATEDVD